MKKSLIIGYGSIGARHCEVLKSLGSKIAVLSSHYNGNEICFTSLDEALSEFKPDYVIVANKTSMHIETIDNLKFHGFSGDLLVEKPIFHEMINKSYDCFRSINVAYNLRFHPLVIRLKNLIKDEEIISSSFYVGQHLSSWRPGRDYRTIYSASSKDGGGVLHDLSHDIDLIYFLLGKYEKLAAIGGKFSNLEISSDDVFSVLISTTLCPVVTLQMNYLDRNAKRRILINTNKHTFELDLNEGKLFIDNNLETYKVPINQSYADMHKSILMNSDDFICSFEDGIKTLNIIQKCINANNSESWIKV